MMDGKVVVNCCLGMVLFDNVGICLFFYYFNIWNYFLFDSVLIFLVLFLGLLEMQVIMIWLVYKDVQEGMDYDFNCFIEVWVYINDEDC